MKWDKICKNIYLANSFKNKKIDRKYKTFNLNINELKQYVNDNKLGDIKLIDIYDYILSPQKLKLKEVKYIDLDILNSYECWTDSECVLINEDYYRSFIKS